MNNGTQNGNQAASGDEKDQQTAMIDLLEHLLQEHWGYLYQGQRPQLLPGEKPAKLAVEIPIPNESRIVGSVMWTDKTSIIYDCSMERDAVLRFYEESLLTHGWTKPEMPGPFGGGGFTHSAPGRDFGASFCMGEKGPSLYIRAFTSEKKITSMHITLNTDPEQSPCSPRQRRQFESMRHFSREVLPILQPPAGAIQLGGGSGGNGHSMSSDAWLKTDLDISATLGHYNEQLANANWQQLDAGAAAPIGWSAWEVKYEEEKWYGFLTVIGYPWAKGEYRLTLRAEVQDIRERDGIYYRQV